MNTWSSKSRLKADSNRQWDISSVQSAFCFDIIIIILVTFILSIQHLCVHSRAAVQVSSWAAASSLSGRFSTTLPTRRRTGTTCCQGSMSSWIRSRCFLRANGTPASASSPRRASRLRWAAPPPVRQRGSLMLVLSDLSSAPCLRPLSVCRRREKCHLCRMAPPTALTPSRRRSIRRDQSCRGRGGQSANCFTLQDCERTEDWNCL